MFMFILMCFGSKSDDISATSVDKTGGATRINPPSC